MSGVPNTAVPGPVLGPDGFLVPAESAILTGVQSDINGAFGNKLTFTTTSGSITNSTPQAQLASSESAIIADCYNVFLWYTNMVDPAYSVGRMQDAIGRLYFLDRIPATPTVVQAQCTGSGVTIPIGALAQAQDGNIYTCTVPGTLPSTGGTITLPFQCSTPGPIVCPENFLTTIYTAIPGWDTINNSEPGVIGNNVETASQFEQRRSVSVGWQSLGWQGAILGGLLSAPGVLDAYVYDNANNSAQTVGGVELYANSIFVCVLGGNASDIAAAIWSRKPPGTVYNGNTSYIYTDPNPAYNPPAPSYVVTWWTAQLLDFAVLVKLVNNGHVPSNAEAQVQQAIINAFAGLDGGSRAKIGSTLYASRYYSTVVALGSWAQQIVSIQLGPRDITVFNGTISGTTLTVQSVTSGTIAIGQFLTDDAQNLAAGTMITGGSGTSWTVSISQTISTSEVMNGATIANDYTVDINTAPTIEASGIRLQFVTS
jgi:hypothetical protein